MQVTVSRSTIVRNVRRSRTFFVLTSTYRERQQLSNFCQTVSTIVKFLRAGKRLLERSGMKIHVGGYAKML